MRKIVVIAFSSVVSSCPVWGQEETSMEEVVIHAGKQEKSLKLELNTEVIQNKLASDVGNLLILFPGLQVKNYGDVGGLKTVSFRSLGPGHSSVVQDFTALSQTQSGQSDLSTIPADFVQQLELITLSPTRVDIPIHSKLAGAVINCVTVHGFSNSSSHKFILGVQGGSFDQYEAYGMGKLQRKKLSAGISGKFRSYQGRFPFTYQNGQQTIREKRTNNGLLEYYGTASLQYAVSEHHTFQLRISANEYRKELAGAVIFYNNHANQFLNGAGLVSSINHRYKKKKWEVFSTVNYQKNHLQYLDSSYLNLAGYLDSRYDADQLDVQSQTAYSVSPKLDLLFGSSFIHEKLQASTLTSSPFRATSESIIGMQWKSVGTIMAQLGLQGVIEERGNQNSRNWNLLPALLWWFDLPKNQNLTLSYRYTLRQPSFSELYYQQVGNKDLRTEKAQIAALRYAHTLPFTNGFIQSIVQPYYTYTNDRILAIPTKNLFVWSILNIGKSEAFGVEWTEQFKKQVKQSVFGVRLNYTFQYARDISDPASAVYKHLLSYSPLHSGSLELNYTRKKFSFFILTSYLGERYALNQNIPSNLLEDYLLLDAGASYSQKVKTGEFTIRMTVNNITNRQYAYIRYFVMPGTHFNIRLHYAF